MAIVAEAKRIKQIHPDYLILMLIDPRNNYDVDLKEDFKNLNTYESQFEKSYNIVKRKE